MLGFFSPQAKSSQRSSRHSKQGGDLSLEAARPHNPKTPPQALAEFGAREAQLSMPGPAQTRSLPAAKQSLSPAGLAPRPVWCMDLPSRVCRDPVLLKPFQAIVKGCSNCEFPAGVPENTHTPPRNTVTLKIKGSHSVPKRCPKHHACMYVPGVSPVLTQHGGSHKRRRYKGQCVGVTNALLVVLDL